MKDCVFFFNLVSIEDNVIEVKDNAIKAENEINEAEKITRKTSRRVFWLFILVCFLVVSLILIIIFIFLPSDNKDKKFLLN